jgi:type I pantothenate kinase
MNQKPDIGHGSACLDHLRDIRPTASSAEEWASFRADTPLTLTEDEVQRLSSLNDPIDLDEVRRIYLSLSRLLSAMSSRARSLFASASASSTSPTPEDALHHRHRRLGRGRQVDHGARAEGTAVALAVEPEGRPDHHGRLPATQPISRERNLMERKGFPESYDVGALLRFLSAIKSGQAGVRAPVYSHLSYDVLPDEFVTIDRPDILIFEGINVLQSRDLPADGKIVPIISDFFDFSIYIDADEALIHRWYVTRFMRLRETAFRDPESFFHRYSQLSDRCGARHRRRPVGQHQPEEPAREHPADAAARRSHPAQGRRSPDRGSGAFRRPSGRPRRPSALHLSPSTETSTFLVPRSKESSSFLTAASASGASSSSPMPSFLPAFLIKLKRPMPTSLVFFAWNLSGSRFLYFRLPSRENRSSTFPVKL